MLVCPSLSVFSIDKCKIKLLVKNCLIFDITGFNTSSPNLHVVTPISCEKSAIAEHQNNPIFLDKK